MRGYLQPGKRLVPSDEQQAFAALSRGRRSKIATAANTTLLKADQWADARGATAEIAEALVKGLEAMKAPKKKK